MKARILAYLLCLLLAGSHLVLASEVVVTANRLNLRRTPERDGKVVAVLERGDRLDVTATHGEWVEVSWRKKTGFLRNRPIYIQTVSENPDSVVGEQKRLEHRIRNRKDRMATLSKEERKLLATLESIEKSLSLSQKKKRQFLKRAKSLESRNATLLAQKKRLQSEIRAHQDETGQRLVALYKREQSGWLDLLPPSRDITEFIETGRNLSLILKQDEALLSAQTRRLARLDALESELADKTAELATTRKALFHEIEGRNRDLASRRKLLSDIRTQSKTTRIELEQLVIKRAVLEKALARLEQSRILPQGASFQSRKGLLAMPVEGTIRNRFGAVRRLPGSGTVRSRGLDITADLGDPIRAVHGGKVAYADWLAGYGNMIIIDHGQQFFTVYAHAEELFKKSGDHVESREVIATIGESGSLVGPMLHFEIRQKGKPVDPAGWIQTP